MPHLQRRFGIVAERDAQRITIFDTQNLNVLHVIEDPSLNFTDVIFTSDCTRALATATGDATAESRIVQIDMTQEPPVIIDETPVEISVQDIALTPDNLFAVATDGSSFDPGVEGMVSYSVPDQFTDTLLDLSLQAVAVSPNGNNFILATDIEAGRVRVLEIGVEGNLTDTGDTFLTGPNDQQQPMNVRFHPSGNFAFIANFAGNNVAVFDTTNPNTPALLDNVDTVTAGPQTIITSRSGDQVFVLTRTRVERYRFTPVAPFLALESSFDHNLAIGFPRSGVDQLAYEENLGRLFVSASVSEVLAAFTLEGDEIGRVPGVLANGGVDVCLLQQPQPTPRSTSTHTCKATVVEPNPVSSGDPIAKVPVLLQEVSVQIPMHAEIDFPAVDPVNPERVLEIKTIKKRTFVTQCRLLNLPGATSGQLFISGFVRKNIQYAANPVVDAAGEILSDIKSLTVEVPFDCVTTVEDFITPPVGPFLDTRDEFGYLISKPLGTGFPEKDRLTGSDLSQFHQINSASYNELPYCELVQADIIEIDESLDRTPLVSFFPNTTIGEGTFTRLSEKMILDLTLKLFQKQQVRVNATDDNNEETDSEN